MCKILKRFILKNGRNTYIQILHRNLKVKTLSNLKKKYEAQGSSVSEMVAMLGSSN